MSAIAERQRDEEFLWHLAGTIADLLALDDFVVYLREGASLTQVAAVGIKAPTSRNLFDPITIPIGHAVVGDSARRKETVHIPDLSDTAGYIPDHVDGQSELTVPVLLDNEVVAVFDSEATTVGAFADWQINTLELFAVAAAPAIVLWKEQRDEWLRVEQARGLQAQALSTFAGTVAHDLNNILAVIELNTEVLRRDANANATKRIQNSLSDAVMKARRLTGRLLSLTTNGPLTPEMIDVGDLLVHAAEELGVVENINVVLDLEDALPMLLADAVQIPQLVTNLMINAVEAIGDQQGTITVTAKADPSDPTMVEIAISDDGPGIDPDTMKRIFDPYFSTKPNGVGLGLASAYWAALQHGGQLEVRSRPGHGTTFTLRLPGQMSRVVESPPEPEPERKLKVLVLEDDSLVAQSLLDVLEFCGHNTALVRRGEDVASTWQTEARSGQPFDVALLDLRNELGQDGTFALDRLRAIDPDVRAIAMSGYSADGLRETMQHGFVATIAKPFRVDELNKVLSDATRIKEGSTGPAGEGL